MSMWGDIHRRNSGEMVREEDEICDIEKFAEALEEDAKNGNGDLASILNGLKKKLEKFNYDSLFKIEDENHLLLPNEKLLLQAALILPFKLGKYYSSLEEVLTIQGIRVIIKSGTPAYEVPTGLDIAIKDLEKELEVWKKKLIGKIPTLSSENIEIKLEDLKSYCFIRHIETLEEKTKFFELIDLLKRLKGQRTMWENMPLRGRYLPEEKEIHLFPNNMVTERNKRLVSTLAHETMHAYFDRYPHNCFSYVRPVEEPLAEFGMLLYLKETNLKDYYIWARTDVESKKTCYRYGVALMEQYERESKSSLNPPTREDLESYKDLEDFFDASYLKTRLSKYWKDYLSYIYDYVVRPMTFRKGMIIADDDSGEVLKSVDSFLHFGIMKQKGKFNEITIDKYWPFNDCRSILFAAAEKANNGLLVINVTTEKLFEELPCRVIKELSKQEEADLRFDGYVLLVIKDIKWKDIVKYAKGHSKGQFEDMMNQWFDLIK